MKRWILVMMCAFLYVMPVNATELGQEEPGEVAETEEAAVEESSAEESSAEVAEDAEETSSQGEETSSEAVSAETEEGVANSTEEIIPAVTEEGTEETEVSRVEIPDVTGMTETDAIAVLGAIALSDGATIEIIKEYAYSNDAEKDIVYEQSISGVVNEEEAKQIKIFISLGQNPSIAPSASNSTIGSKFSEVNWNDVPIDYEYNYDNSNECWNNGLWYGGVCYKSPYKTYNNNVRHIIQLYYDDKYVYVHAVMATCYGQNVNGNDYMFFFDGHETKFRLLSLNGNDLSNENWSAGTHPLIIKHEKDMPSGTDVVGGEAYCTVFENGLNTDVQLRIPLSEFKRQNEDVNLDNIGKITFFTNNLMYRHLTASGASTFPLATAAVALVLVPGSAYIINKKRKPAKKELNEK